MQDLNESEQQLLAKFMPSNANGSRDLAEIIMQKVNDREAQLEAERKKNAPAPLDEKVVDVFTQYQFILFLVELRVGVVLSRYTSGKLPKAFKILPSLKNWEEILALTKPENWTPNAMYAATLLFMHNLNPKLAQRFLVSILLPAIRDDISKNKRLNFHYYTALKKAVYKPAAFFKGLVLPLLQDATIDDDSGRKGTIREAVIIASVVAKVSLPVEHAAATMLKLIEMPFGISAIILKTLLDKKYSLPISVIAALIKYFLSFLKEDRQLPVLWHQTLLVFAQRYKLVITIEQKELLKPLLRAQFHRLITPEIRRELFGKTFAKADSNDMDVEDEEMKLA